MIGRSLAESTKNINGRRKQKGLIAEEAQGSETEGQGRTESLARGLQAWWEVAGSTGFVILLLLLQANHGTKFVQDAKGFHDSRYRP